MNAFSLNGLLPPWSDVSSGTNWDAILLGNGASRAVWDAFNYASLFERAKEDIEHPLTSADQDLFKALGTENFEKVLSSLVTTAQVATAPVRIPRST